MSYCRFGWGGSEVYIFSHVNGGIECCGCSLSESRMFNTSNYGRFGGTDDETPYDERETTNDFNEMIAHVGEHIAAGHRVPLSVMPALVADRDGTDPELTDEVRADNKYIATDVANFSDIEDPELRELLGADPKYTPHPAKALCNCGSGKKDFMCCRNADRENYM